MKKIYGRIFLSFMLLGMPISYFILTGFFALPEYFQYTGATILFCLLFGLFYTSMFWVVYAHHKVRNLFKAFLLFFLLPLVFVEVVLSVMIPFSSSNCVSCMIGPGFALVIYPVYLAIPSLMGAAILTMFFWKARRDDIYIPPSVIA